MCKNIITQKVMTVNHFDFISLSIFYQQFDNVDVSKIINYYWYEYLYNLVNVLILILAEHL